MSLNDYLLFVKNNYLKIQNIIIVLGNESCDLDSMVSSLVYSYYLYKKTNTIHLPVINIESVDEIYYRNEAVEFFKQVGLNIENFIYWGFVKNLNVSKVILVDHNRLSLKQENLYKDKIEEIIDHHVDEKLYKSFSMKIIEPVGSCCTLIAEMIGGIK